MGIWFCSFCFVYSVNLLIVKEVRSIKTHPVNNKLFSKSHQSLLLDDVQRYETSTEMEKEKRGWI